MDELTLKIEAPVMVINNIDTSDGTTNGTLGTLAQVIKNSKNEIHYVVIDFNNPSKGRSNTVRHENITKGKPGRIVIEKLRWDYALPKKGGSKKEATATVIQFPVRLAWGITLHKTEVSE